MNDPLTRTESLQLLSASETADLLGVNATQLEIWRRKGSGPKYVRLNQRCVRYRLGDLVEYLEAHLVGSGT
jgi:hypothetical protein